MTLQVLSQDEVDALLQGITDDSDAAEPAPAGAAGGMRDYDLRDPDRIQRAPMPALEIVNERFVRNIRGGIFDLIRQSPEVAPNGIRLQKYSDFLREIAVPTSFNIVGVRPLRGSGLIVCSPSLVFCMIDALFGGSGKFPTRMEGREFSATEQRVIGRLVETIGREYKKAWEGIYPLELQYQRSEMLPQFATIAAPGEVVVTTSFTLEIGDATGEIHLCIPYATLEPIREILYSTVRGDASPHDPRWVELLKQQIQPAEVELIAELAHAPATLEQLLALKAGDFIELDLKPVIQATIRGVPLFDCHYGTSNGKYSLKVDRLLDQSGTGWMRAGA